MARHRMAHLNRILSNTSTADATQQEKKRKRKSNPDDVMLHSSNKSCAFRAESECFVSRGEFPPRKKSNEEDLTGMKALTFNRRKSGPHNASLNKLLRPSRSPLPSKQTFPVFLPLPSAHSCPPVTAHHQHCAKTHRKSETTHKKDGCSGWL